MADTGWLNPSSNGNNNNDWTDGANAYASDDTYATRGTTYGVHDWGNFGISLPANTGAIGIEVKLEKKIDSGSASPITKVSKDNGVTPSSGSASVTWSSTENTSTLGTDYLWGETWTASDFNNGNFAVIQYNALGKICYLDHVQVRITYTSLPTVISSAASNIQNTSATVNGEITNVDVDNCSERGFVYGESSQTDPGNTASHGYDNIINEAGDYGTGVFSLRLSGLKKNTTYYYRSYAKNAAGYDYSNTEQSFTTLSSTSKLIII